MNIQRLKVALIAGVTAQDDGDYQAAQIGGPSRADDLKGFPGMRSALPAEAPAVVENWYEE